MDVVDQSGDDRDQGQQGVALGFAQPLGGCPEPGDGGALEAGEEGDVGGGEPGCAGDISEKDGFGHACWSMSIGCLQQGVLHACNCHRRFGWRGADSRHDSWAASSSDIRLGPSGVPIPDPASVVAIAAFAHGLCDLSPGDLF